MTAADIARAAIAALRAFGVRSVPNTRHGAPDTAARLRQRLDQEDQT
jgi:hypothetical protein